GGVLVAPVGHAGEQRRDGPRDVAGLLLLGVEEVHREAKPLDVPHFLAFADAVIAPARDEPRIDDDAYRQVLDGRLRALAVVDDLVQVEVARLRVELLAVVVPAGDEVTVEVLDADAPGVTRGAALAGPAVEDHEVDRHANGLLVVDVDLLLLAALVAR